MKLITFIALVTIIVGTQALSEEQKRKIVTISKECKEATGVSQELIDRGRNNDLIDDPALKKHILCVLKKVGITTESGDFNVDVIKSKLKRVSVDDEEVDTIVRECVVKKDAPEESGFAFSRCMVKKKPDFPVVD